MPSRDESAKPAHDPSAEAASLAAKTRLLLGAVEFWLNVVTALLVGGAGALLYLEMHARGLPAMFVIASALSLVILLLVAITRFFPEATTLNRSVATLVGLLVCLALIGLGLTIWPQGHITLRVTHENEAIVGVKDVPVELMAKGRGAVSATTGQEGYVIFERVPIGDYALRVVARPPITLRGVMAPWGRAEYEVNQPPTATTQVLTEALVPTTATPNSSGNTQTTRSLEEPASFTPTCCNVLIDSGFDAQDAAWEWAPTDTRSPFQCKSSLATSQPCLLTLGERDTHIEAYQTVAIEENAQSRIAFSYYIRARAPGQAPGQCQVLVRDAQTGAPLLIIATLVPTANEPQTFKRFHYDLTPEEIAFLARRGAPVQLVFSLTQRERLGMVVYVDDVIWQICS